MKQSCSTRAPRKHTMQAAPKRTSLSLVRWFDSWAGTANDSTVTDKDAALAAEEAGLVSIDWGRVVPFLLMHASVLFVFVVGFSWVALITAVALYAVRMFGITAGYHRYFSHNSFKTSRFGQFCLAVLGASAAQRGPLWWAAHHRPPRPPTSRRTSTRRPRRASSGPTSAGSWTGRTSARASAREGLRAPSCFLDPSTSSCRRYSGWRCSCSAWRSRSGRRDWGRTVGRCWSGASSSRRSPSTTARSPSTP